jgi:signal transduction histidine kinase
VVPIRELGWVAHASRPRAQILGEARGYAARFGAAALAVAIAALAAASLLASRIAGPLRALEHHASELGQGSPGPMRSRGPLEVRRVARALDAMAASLSRRRVELEAAHREAQDATEHAQARGAELDAIVAALPVGLVVLDAGGRAARVNDVAVEILALEEADLALSPAERWERCRPSRADGSPLGADGHPAVRALAGETVRGEVVRIERRGGGPAWIAASAAPIRAPDGQGRGAVLTIVDVTQLRGLEAERDTLIHTVSHDLRTPLHVIVSHAELLRRRGDEEARHRADAILAAAGRMTRLVGDLVDAARLETGRVQLHLEAIDLARFLPAWRERVTGALPVERVRVSTAGAIPAVVADPARLDQILANLVSNALKYSPDDAAVDVELARTGRALRLSVRDRGPGIPPEDLPRVFERYWRGTGAARAEGLGLGLFITRKLVEAHGWSIEAASALGEGSVFTVVVPLERTRAAPAEGAAA